MTEANANEPCREVLYSGRVQGVGFRYTTREIARRFPVRGFVKNLPDGRVQLVVEGPSAAVEQFVAAVEAELERYIEHREASQSAPRGEFQGFEVAY